MKRSGVGFYTMGIAALFLAGFFLLVMFGARTYRDAAAAQSEHNEQRALLSYLSTCVKSNDRAGCVYVQQEDGPVLVVADGSGFGLRVYQRGGQLLEEYSALDGELHPEEAEVLGNVGTFSVEEIKPGTLRIATDAGTVLLHLRSGGEPE